MSTLITRSKRFTSFGPSILIRQTRGLLKGSQIPRERLAARQMLRDECPTLPGVYGWLDSNRQLVYVGKSKSLRSRLLSYFAKTPSDNKMVRIRQTSETLVWEPISNELLALIREQELIHRWRPDFNRQGQPNRMQPAFVCISHSPAPNAYLSRKISPRAGLAFGPIAGTRRLRLAIESLNHEFQLRDCGDKTQFTFNDQLQLFGNLSTAQCIRHELGTCPAPCAGYCSTGEYQQRVERLHGFLAGRDRGLLDQLKARMNAAAKNQSFEQAANIRDHLDHLSWLDRRLNGLRMSEEVLDGVLQIEARKDRLAWLVLRQGKLVQSIAYHANRPDRAQAAMETLTEIANRQTEMPSTRLDISLQLLIVSWFRKHPHYRRQIIGFEQAIESCRRCLQAGLNSPA